jgi:hypothetical protein
MQAPLIRKLRLGAFLAPLFLVTASASAGTIATFADPAPDGSTPLFELAGTTFTGGWTGSNLTLEVPVTGNVWQNATFTMTPLTVTGIGQLSSGTLEFHKSPADGGGLVLQIDFNAAFLAPFGFGASDTFVGQVVTFTGPGIPGGLSEETFAFSFANPVYTGNGFTYTASFTSSAVPEPSSLVLLGLGLVRVFRRH